MASADLPVQLTSFIGREGETAQIAQLLQRPEVHLLTITGPGGVAKTSLALQVVRQINNAFSDGARFISLSTIRDPTLIVPTIAQALGVAESPSQLLFESLKEFLCERQILLLIDNFEQVISAAPLLTELLAACGKLKILVTSREALRLRGEHEFPLAPLELAGWSLSPEDLSRAPAIALFVQRAQASQPDFRLTSHNAAAVAEICTRLDGLPLAIELAAARIKLLPPQAMLVPLRESSLSFLTGSARDAPARQQTLRNTILWSYDLLDPAERRAFRRLSVFVGGCTLAAAVSMIDQQFPAIHDKKRQADNRSSTALDPIGSLVDKSLMRQAETDGEPRLGMLDTIRDFGFEQLAQENELEAIQRAHAQYFLSLVKEAEPHLPGREQKAWLKRLADEQDNLRAALDWGFEHQEAVFVLRLAGALWQFWFLRGQWSEGRRWLEEALSIASEVEVTRALRAKVLYAAATQARYQYDLVRARVLCEQSIALYRELGDKEGLLATLLQLCRILAFQGDYQILQAQLPEVLTLAEELPDGLVKAQVYNELPVIGVGSVDLGMAARYLAEGERIYRHLDDPAGIAFTLLAQATLAALQGDTPRAQALFGEGERLAAEAQDYSIQLRILKGHPTFAWLIGDDALARRKFEQLILALREMNDTEQDSALPSLIYLPAVLHRQGLSAWAARVYGLTDKLTHTRQPLMMSGELFDPLKTRAAAVRGEVRLHLGEEAFDRAYAEGQTMTVEDLLTIPHPSPSNSTSDVQAAPASLPYEPLTPRELDVLRLLAQDLSNPQIAERLIVSRRTIEAHLRSIYGKLGVKSRDAAIRLAREYGLVEKK